MSKCNIGLIGNDFTHLTGGNKGYSVHGKESIYINWVQPEVSNIVVCLNGSVINEVNRHENKLKIGWLLESSEIIPNVINEMKANYKFYASKYDTIFTCDGELLKLTVRG